MESATVSNQEFLAYHEKVRDYKMNDIVPSVQRTGSHVERFEISRLLCDVERFIGPVEPMEQYGMGFCYERAYDGKVIKSVTPEILEKTKVYYDRHHDRMNTIALNHSHLLLFDLHSFSDDIVPKDYLSSETKTPDVCIGTDPLYTPHALTEIIRQHLDRETITFLAFKSMVH